MAKSVRLLFLEVIFPLNGHLEGSKNDDLRGNTWGGENENPYRGFEGLNIGGVQKWGVKNREKPAYSLKRGPKRGPKTAKIGVPTRGFTENPVHFS